jgi:hyperosmotically inducible periplasmic protein
MTHSPCRKVLIIAGVAATLGLGAAGCNSGADQSSQQASASQSITDTAITAGVKSRLALNRDLDSSDISVATDHGTVTLTGSVPDKDTRSAAERATRASAGVTDVDNRLNVAAAEKSTGESIQATGEAATQAMSDTWITTKVKSVLLADSDAKGLDIKVNTKDGVVTLQGMLASQAAIDHVKALAMDVKGVKHVNTNALTIASR